MTTQLANAYPTKDFFLRMLTRDISLEDCVMDLVDNSLDALLRTRTEIKVTDNILVPAKPLTDSQRQKLPTVNIQISETKFEVVDDCGGIPRDKALHDVFIYGHEKQDKNSKLGVYGIGLKRAVFKIGNNISIQSRTAREGFKAAIDLDKWSQEKGDWTIPITFIDGAGSGGRAGTVISVEALHEEVKMRVKSGILVKQLVDALARTYSPFLERYVRIRLNGRTVEPNPIPLGWSSVVKPAIEKYAHKLPGGTVRVTLIASLAGTGIDSKWKPESAGWYALCNGRVVVAADRTDLTGWGLGGPIFHSKFSKFVGIVFFYSDNPELLPWTTTKQSINRDSQVYQKARGHMSAVMKPITSFLNRQYPSDAFDESDARGIAGNVSPVDMRKVLAQTNRPFTVKETKGRVKTTTRIQYDAQVVDIEKVKKRLRKPRLSAGQVGLATFEHYLKTECPE
ncbi:MAG: ATP-binding protein [bacterium]|nr:ATP-binding protein [bacterium]